jgi:hypothetical protein
MRVKVKVKVKAIKAWTGPVHSRSLRLPEVLDNRHMKVVRLTALTHQPPLSPQISLVFIFVRS